MQRLKRVGDDALELARGVVPAAPPPGDDEIARLDRSLRTIFAMAHAREKMLKDYQLLAEQAELMIVWIDASENIVDANRAAIKGYGYSHEELLTIRPSSVRAAVGGQSFGELLAGARAAGSVSYETIHRRKCGETFPAEVWLQATDVDDAPMIVAMIRDITDRKRAQSAAAAQQAAIETSLRLKSEFVATMSHEIRTPMNAVIGMTELLLDSELDGDQRQHGEIIRDAGLALLGIIDDILDFSKIEAGQMELERSDVDVVDLVESAAAVLADRAHRKGIALMTRIGDGVPASVVSDHLRIRQVLINLIGNAVKFTDAGSVVVAVSCDGRRGDAASLRFAVRDSGIGMDDATARKIFEPFRQADGSTTRKYGGTGLGLSISRRLVHLLGGELEVRSSPGAGAEFSFALALEPGLAAYDARASSLAGAHALVVDADAMSRAIAVDVLHGWGLKTSAVAHAGAALAKLRSAAEAGEPFDVVLVDDSLRGTDALAFAGLVKRDPLVARAALLLVTAVDAAKRGQSALAAGYERYLPRPIRRAQLHDALADALAARAAGDRSDECGAPLPAERPAIAARPERILLVEDDPVNRLLARRQLEKLGFVDIAGVHDGEQAVRAFATGTYDLVLMDCQMPAMDGLEATRAIRRTEALAGRHVPIVAMTANARSDDRDACIAAGMDDYLSKPVRLAQLLAILDARLPRWAAAGVAR